MNKNKDIFNNFSVSLNKTGFILLLFSVLILCFSYLFSQQAKRKAMYDDKSSSRNTVFDFRNGIVVKLYRGQNSNKKDFIYLPEKVFEWEKTNIESIYGGDDWGNYKFFDSKSARYFIFEPGGRKEIALIANSEFTSLVGTNLKNKDANDNSFEVVCKPEKRLIGDVEAVAVTCTYRWYSSSDKHLLLEEKTTNCYIPINNYYYLGFEQTQKPVGDVDLCNEISELGYYRISLL